VKEPVVTTFATTLPETVPNTLDATTATLAGPPRYRPTREMPSLRKNSPAPET
jgi:hypothetical protein